MCWKLHTSRPFQECDGVLLHSHISKDKACIQNSRYLIFFVIRQSEQICKWGIRYAHLVTTDHMGSTCAHHYPHTKFHQCSPYRTLDIWFFFGLLTNQNRYANEVLNMRIWWWQTTWVVLVPITTHIPGFINVAHTELWIFDFIVISQSEQTRKWGIKYAHSVPTDHMGSTCAHHYPQPSFINVAHTELWIFDFFVISQSEQICKWGIKSNLPMVKRLHIRL